MRANSSDQLLPTFNEDPHPNPSTSHEYMGTPAYWAREQMLERLFQFINRAVD